MQFANQPIFLLAGYLLVLILGVGLYRTGRPYPGALFNVHKLVALGVVVLGAVIARRSGVFSGMSGEELITVILVIVSTLALFVSGAMQSAGKLGARRMRMVHSVAAVLLSGVLAMAFLGGAG